MSKEKKSSGKSAPKKAAAKTSAAPKAAAPKNSKAEEIAATAPVSAPHLASAIVAERTPQPPPAMLYDEIRRRAYEFYRARGGQHGSHEADWHRAESEVRSKYK